MRAKGHLCVGVCFLLVAMLIVAAAYVALMKQAEISALEQVQVFYAMKEKCSDSDPSLATQHLRYVVEYYPSGTKHLEGTVLDALVERVRDEVVEDIIVQLRVRSQVDLGDNPYAWISEFGDDGG